MIINKNKIKSEIEEKRSYISNDLCKNPQQLYNEIKFLEDCLKTGQVNVPEEFKPKINVTYPPENYEIFEEWVSNNYTSNFNRKYLPIHWTSYHVNNKYGIIKSVVKRLQEFVDNLPRNQTYWTICQYDDGVLINFKNLDVLVFHMSKKTGVEIPLVCMPHSYKTKEKKDIFASFIGKETHPLRKEIFNIKNPKYYISKQNHNIQKYCEILDRSVFGLCPRGYGLNSFRTSECMQYETIPVYISDEFIGVFDDNFEEYGIKIKAKDANKIEKILNDISQEEIENKRKKIKEYYNKYYVYEGLINQINEKLINDNKKN
jgi:hypothetical protein